MEGVQQPASTVEHRVGMDQELQQKTPLRRLTYTDVQLRHQTSSLTGEETGAEFSQVSFCVPPNKIRQDLQLLLSKRRQNRIISQHRMVSCNSEHHWERLITKTSLSMC